MDMLAAMFRMAERSGVLSNLGTTRLKHRVSLYADDVVVFARPGEDELIAVRGILDYFSEASRLKVNFAKSVVAPIYCPETAVELFGNTFSC
jgi:hypothetical protein